MLNQNHETVAQALLPVSAEGRTSWWLDTGRKAFATAAWTVAGVGTLILAGMAINQVGIALKLPYACWQLTGARAAASTAVLGTLLSLRRGNLGLFGLLYGVWLLATHSSGLLVGSAILAGIGAWIVSMVLADRGLPVRLLATTLAFNVLLTLSALVKLIAGDASSHTTLGGWAGGVGLRAIATAVVVGVIAAVGSGKRGPPMNADERG